MAEEANEVKDDRGTDTTPAKKKRRMPSKKVLAVVLTVILVSASVFTVWFFYFRHWSARELADRMVIDDGRGWTGFESELAGRSVVVEGTVTTIDAFETTLGNVTVVELDNVAESSLVYWGAISYEIGDRIERKISFEWSYWNDDKHVFSPQIWLPLGYAYGGAVVRDAVSHVSSDGGMICLLNEGNDVRIRLQWLGEPSSLDMANCTLYAGNRSGFFDVLGLGDNYRVREIDSIHDLTEGVGQNQTIEFYDENGDGYLDNGDSFLLRNLSRPDTESGIKTYALRVEWPVDLDMEYFGIHGLSCYIPVRMDGAVFPTSSESPIVRGFLEPDDDARTLTIDYVETTIPWENMTIQLSDGTNFVQWEPTMVGPLAESLGIKSLGTLYVDANITHTKGNGIVSPGDRVTVSAAGTGNFSSSAVYTLTLRFEGTGGWVLEKGFCVNDTPVARLEPYIPTGWSIDGVGFTFTSAHVGFNNTYRPFDLSWDDVIVNLTDGVNTVSWTASSSSLHLGFGAGASFANLTLGSVSVQLNVYDLNGDGQVNNGDRLELRTPDVSGFSSSTTYTVTAIYSHTDTDICSAEFTG